MFINLSSSLLNVKDLIQLLNLFRRKKKRFVDIIRFPSQIDKAIYRTASQNFSHKFSFKDSGIITLVKPLISIFFLHALIFPEREKRNLCDEPKEVLKGTFYYYIMACVHLGESEHILLYLLQNGLLECFYILLSG